MAQMVILEAPLPMILVAGDEYGRLSLEVIRFSLNRLFFLPSHRPPSTSHSGLRRFTDWRFTGPHGDEKSSKQKVVRGPAAKVKNTGGVFAGMLLNQVYIMLIYQIHR